MSPQASGRQEEMVARRRRFGESGVHLQAWLFGSFGKGWSWQCLCGVAGSSHRKSWALARWLEHRDRELELRREVAARRSS